jgi:hypothetical protein
MIYVSNPTSLHSVSNLVLKSKYGFKPSQISISIAHRLRLRPYRKKEKKDIGNGDMFSILF